MFLLSLFSILAIISSGVISHDSDDVENEFFNKRPKLHQHKSSMKDQQRGASSPVESNHHQAPFGIDKIDLYFNEFKSVRR